MENFFTIAMIQQDTLLGTIIVGPSLYSEMDNEMLNTLVSELDLRSIHSRTVRHRFVLMFVLLLG